MLSVLLLRKIVIALCVVEAWCHWNLSIIHFNDFHARYQSCENRIGGFSRLYATVKLSKENNPNSLLLNAGDNFQGSLWYIVQKWNVTQHFLNKLPLDAITLGNHEFDDGVAGLAPFLRSVKAPVVVSNIDDSWEPRLRGLYDKSIVVENRGRRIGIVGVLTTTAQSTSKTESVLLRDELESVDSEANRLENSGVFTVLVLSHCGYELDLEIARRSTSKVSIVIGGHTDTFLYTGTPVPGPDEPSGPYPTVVTNQAGRKVLVVQASAYAKYLGNLSVTYDDDGAVTAWSGAPIFLGPEVSSDPDIDAELNVWKGVIDLEGNRVVGRTKFTMLNKPCRSEECPLGNFATDAMIYAYANRTGDPVAMIHAGGMRANIEEGNITFYELTTTFPFQDTINLCEIKGEHIKEILESAVDNTHLVSPHIFQVSGLRVVYNLSKSEGERVKSLQTCPTMSLCEEIDYAKYYHVLLPTFLTDSSFNPLFRKHIRNKIIGETDTEIYKAFLEVRSPLTQKVDGRVYFEN